MALQSGDQLQHISLHSLQAVVVVVCFDQSATAAKHTAGCEPCVSCQFAAQTQDGYLSVVQQHP